MTASTLKTLSISILIIASASLHGCANKDDAGSGTNTTAGTNTTTATGTAMGTAMGTAAGTATGSATATESLAEPGSLKAIMVQLNSEMARLQSGLWTEDLEVVAQIALRVAEHPKVSDSEKKRVLQTLADDFGAFVALDKAVHDSAVRLSEAAAGNDLTQTVEELGVLQKNCIACHSQFRSRLKREIEP